MFIVHLRRHCLNILQSGMGIWNKLVRENYKIAEKSIIFPWLDAQYCMDYFPYQTCSLVTQYYGDRVTWHVHATAR